MERNPGYGHPLRPEFRLTPTGQSAAAMASDILDVLNEEEQALLRRSWTLPVLSTLQKPRQFVEIKRSLVTVTDRALSQSLRCMEEKRWIHRHVDDEARPPRTIYSAINHGAIIADVTSAVALSR